MAWKVDTAHTQVAFGIRHLGVSIIRGNLRLADAEVALDEAHPESARLKARIDVRTLDTRDANRDKHLTSADFFDVENHPFIEFETKSVSPAADGKFRLAGELTVRGTKRPITLQGEYAGPVIDPISSKRKVGFLLSGEIDKKDFGIAWNVPIAAGGFMLDDKISLTIDAQVIED